MGNLTSTPDCCQNPQTKKPNESANTTKSANNTSINPDANTSTNPGANPGANTSTNPGANTSTRTGSNTGAASVGWRGGLQFIVPANSTYSINGNAGVGGWWEMY